MSRLHSLLSRPRWSSLAAAAVVLAGCGEPPGAEPLVEARAAAPAAAGAASQGAPGPASGPGSAPAGEAASEAASEDGAGPEYDRLGAGWVAWESNRTGTWRIFRRGLDGSGLRQLTPDEPGRYHSCAHISLDGSRLVYLSREGDGRVYDSDRVGVLRMVGADGRGDRVLAAAAMTYHSGNRAAIWRSERELVHIEGDGRTVLRDVDAGTTRVLVARPGERTWLVDATLRHATDQPTFSRYDVGAKVVHEEQEYGGCEPYFSHDGRFGIWIGGAGGPIQRIDLETGAIARVLEKNDRRMPAEQGYIYFPMPSRDSMLLTYAASFGEHDHHRSNYDVFVVETDPRTLEVIGVPLRYTSHPASDRYPDVFLAPLPLGRHFGEAPFVVDLGGGGEAGPELTFDYGDGTAAEHGGGGHVYVRPGTYQVRARGGGRELLGRVTVEKASPPRPLVASPRGERDLVVSFDEAVDAAQARAALGSGAEVLGVEPGPDERTLLVRLAKPLSGADTLRLSGVRDRASRPNEMTEAVLALDPPSWPSRREGLAFLWETADRPNLVLEAGSGAQRTYRVEPRGTAVLDRHRAMSPSGGSFAAAGEVGEALAEACKSTNAVTLEVTLTPESLDQGGPAHIVSLSNGKVANLMLGQDGADLVLRLLTGPKNSGVTLPIARLAAIRPHHVVVSYHPGHLAVFLDGEPALASQALQGDFFHWRSRPLVFGNEWGMKRPWRGAIEGVAIYGRVMEGPEAAENAHRYAALLTARPQVAGLELEGRLRARSRLPTLAEISPYREALVVFEYEVAKVLAGQYDGRRIRVAHWAILDGTTRPIGPAGPDTTPAVATARLVLEPFAAHPQLESTYLSDTLEEDWEAALYYDVGR